MEDCLIKNLYSLDETIAKEFLEKFEYPWEVIPKIHDYILEIGKRLPKDEYEEKTPNVWIHKTAKVFDSAYINGPTIIGKYSEIRHCAFIRENAIIGDYDVVGNSTELKNVILFNYVQVPHYNYVGDSILGFHAHMGAGSILSNVKSDKKLVKIKNENEIIETGLKKVGSFLGDYAEIGCGSVLNPGSVIGKHTNIYPLSMIRGVIKPNCIYKNSGEIILNYL